MVGESSVAYRWGVFVSRRRWAVLAGWLLVLIGCALAYPQLSHNLQGMDYSVTGSDSALVAKLAARHFADLGTEQDALVFHSAGRTVDDPVFRDTVARTLAAIRGQRGVVGAIGPFDPFAQGMVSTDRHAAVALVGLGGTARSNITDAAAIQSRVAEYAGGGIDVTMTGFSPVTNDATAVETADAERGESIGLPVALLVLVLALGAAMAAVVPLVAAGAGLLFGFGVMAALSFTISFDGMLLTIATMIGTGIGIDYSLFIVARVREEFARRGIRDRREHTAIAESVGVAIRTTGRTIAASGLIVSVAMCSLLIVDSPVFHEIAIGVVATVLAVLTVALTLVPALLAVLGPRINAGRFPGIRRATPAHVPDDPSDDQPRGLWASWARTVMRHPVRYGTAAIVLLVILLLPAAGIRYGIDLGTRSLGDTPSGRATTILAQDFSPGLLAPVQVIATGPHDTPIRPGEQGLITRFGEVLHRDPRITQVLATPAQGRMMWTAVPAVPVDSPQAADLVRDLRTEATDLTGNTPGSTQILVGGTSAQFVDLSDETTSKFPWVIGAVLLLSLVFLAVVFRSAILPLKAVLLNLLSTGAALGVTVAVFQWSWGASLLGFHSVGYLQVYLPITVFVVLFGLSMDYEVFLIGRMKEAWDRLSRRADPRRDPVRRNAIAVAEGIEHTARPITAAATIMVVVFAGFISADVLELKEFGVALSVAVAIDAVVVRMILVPAFMQLLGHRNWWPGTRTRHARADRRREAALVR